MKEKGVWLLLTCLLFSAMVLSACSQPGTTTVSSLGTQPTASSAATGPQATTAAAEKPKYGGILNLMSPLDIGVFDPTAAGQYMGSAGFLVNAQYVGEDWAKGAAGTGEIDWSPNTGVAPGNCTGMLAESWEMPTVGTIDFKVRRGVHWALNPSSEASRLMNGRELTGLRDTTSLETGL